MKRFSYSIVGLLTLLATGSCGGKNGGGGLPDITKGVAGLCGFGCPGQTVDMVKIEGVADGNAAVTGVPSVDAFFGAVINFESAADGVNAGIEAQLDAIKADFGIAASANLKTELAAKIQANIDGGITVDYQPAKCAVDASASVQAQAQCEGKVDPGMASLQCKGSCEVDASADVKCDASADLECEFTGPTVDCQGSCEGTCEAKLDAAAKCSGTCTGTCMGNCSAYSDKGATMCAGSCDGMCMGSCEAQVDASAKCMGTCNGSCKVTNPSGGCKGAAHAQCTAHANAMVMCQGKCDGDFTPPMVSAKCEATAKAEAKVNVQCTPPKLAVTYKLKVAASADVMAQAQFEAALKTLISVRLPALLQASAKAKLVAQAGDDLGASGKAAIEGAVADLKANANLRAIVTLGCVPDQLKASADIVKTATERLSANLTAAGDVSGALGIK